MNIQAVKGMKDWLPKDNALWQTIEGHLRALFEQYGYKEIRPPLVEVTELFTRSVGEVTDIVEKEMYSFLDRNQQSLTLRPEGTAGIVRAGIENGLFYNQIQKLWHIGPMFRYEAPQKDRYRQFHQADVEVFGVEGPDIDAEILAMLYRLWNQLGLSNHLQLELNSMGTKTAREAHRTALVDYFTQHMELLDDDSKKRLNRNPLRILDSKNPVMSEMLKNAPKLLDYLDQDSKQHFDGLCQRLNALKIPYIINPRIVRGMDYYTKTVFEWTTTSLGAQGTVCGGGRYDDMVEELGGKPTNAIGFGLGIERLLSLCEQVNLPLNGNAPDLFIIMLGEQAEIVGLTLSEKIRNACPNIKILLNVGAGSIKAQMRKADRSEASIALLIGESELAQNKVTVKFLREEQEQLILTDDDLFAFLQKRYSKAAD